MLKLTLAIVTVTLAVNASAEDPSGRRSSDIRGLMIEALDSADGEAHAIYDGPIAQAMARRFQSAQPIYVDVTTLKRYSQPGCARLNVRVTQVGVVQPEAKEPKDQRVDFGINYCRDGTAPRSLN
jgi:hypothetical protein